MNVAVPYRFSEPAFRRFVPVIAEALASFPSPVRVSHRGKPEGIMQPLRDALTAKRRYRYLDPRIDEHLFSVCSPNLKVFLSDGSAWLGPRSRSSLPVTAVQAAFLVLDHNLLPQVCEIVGLAAVRPMPNFHVKDLASPARTALSQSFHVEFLPVEGQEGTYQIV